MPDFTGVNGLRENFRVVGRGNLPGVLSYALASGIAKFGIDYTAPNMLFAKFLRSPYAHARVKNIDIKKARSIPGVADIVLWNDPELMSLGKKPYGVSKPTYLLQEAHQEKQEVGAVVVAESEDICDEALRALIIEWEELPFIVDLHEGLRNDIPAIRGPEYDESRQYLPGAAMMFSPHYPTDPPRQGNVSYSNKIEGSIEEGYSKADFILEYDTNLPAFASHIPNPPASIAWWFDDPYLGPDKNLHIEGAVQRRENIAQMYGIPANKCIQEGLFQGGKYCDWGMRMSQEITPLLAKRTGRPVRCANTREETFDFCMNQRFCHIKLGVTNEGLITVVDDNSLADHGIPGSSEFGVSQDRDYDSYYTIKCKNISQKYTIVDSNRGFMHTCGQHVPYNWDTLTMGIALIAEKLGKDPVEIAKLNLHGPDSQDDEREVPSFEACLDAGRKATGWSWHPTRTKRLPDGRLHGSSFRYQMCPRHAYVEYYCKLEFRDGIVHLPTQGPIAGIYNVECNAMVVAEELGLEYEDIAVDFDYREKHTPVGGGADGVSGSGWVAKECANILKQEILKAAIREAENPSPPKGFGMRLQKEASPLKGCKPEDLDIMDGKVFVKSNPGRCVPIKEATQENLFATYRSMPPEAAWVKGYGKILDTMNTVWCEVAVDEETGEVEILKLNVAADPGKVIRRTSLESQIDQVMFFSQGCQLFEDYFFDQRTGVRLNTNMIEYKKPTLMDVPKVDKQLLETRLGNAAYGCSGISHSLANTHLIIIAIYNATGVWVDPPATPDKVLKALGKG